MVFTAKVLKSIARRGQIALSKLEGRAFGEKITA